MDNDTKSENWHYSLCQVVSDGKTQYSRLLRLADFLGVKDEISIQKNSPRTLFHNSAYWDDPEYKLLNKNPGELYGKTNQLGIWKWMVDSPGKTFTYVVGQTPFLNFISAFSLTSRQDFNSLVSVIDHLLSGITIPAEIELHPPFLLGIGYDEKNYICLYVENNACKYNHPTIQLKEGMGYTIYSIPKSDFVNSDDVFGRLKHNEITQYQMWFQPRTIYTRYPLTIDPIGTIELHSAIYYTEKHLQNILDTVNYSGEKRDDLKKILSRAIQDEDGFKVLVSKFVNSDANLFLNSYIEQNKATLRKIIESFSDGESEKQFLTNLIEGTPELKQKYQDYLVANYLAEEKAKIKKTVDELEEQKKTMESELSRITKDIETENSKIADLIREKEILIDSKTSLENQLKGAAHEFLENLHIVKDLLGLDCSASSQNENPKETTVSVGTQQLFKRPRVDSSNIDNCTNLDTFEDVIETLSYNLDQIYVNKNNAALGLCEEEKNSYAHLIACSYLNNIPLLCFGHSAHRLAQIISLTLCAETADVLCIPSGFNNYERLLSTIKSIDSKYVILENLVGYSEEYCYLHLSADIPEKRFIFVSEFTDNLKLLPAEIYSSMICLDCNKLSKSPDNIEFGKIGDTFVPDEAGISSSDKNEILRKISKLLNSSPLASGYISLRMPLLEQIKDKNSSVPKLYYELKAILKILGHSDEYLEIHAAEKDKLISDFTKILSE